MNPTDASPPHSTLPRRAFLARSLGAALGLIAAGSIRGEAGEAEGLAQACVLVWLRGGPSHLDTFDPKPGTRTGGRVKTIETALRGVRFAEHFPRLGERAKRLAVVRSLQSKEGDHARATYFVRTGFVPTNTVAHPTWGSVLAHELEGKPALPSFVRLGTQRQDAIGPGYLGASCAGFQPGVALAPSAGVSAARREARRDLLGALERPFVAARGGARQGASAREQALDRAEAVLRGPLRRCLTLEGASAKTRARYGDQAGAPFLQAERLLRAGVRCVEVVVDGWDHHDAIAEQIPRPARALDQGLSALLDDLAQSKRLDRTLVLCMGEFGRTPDLNARAGRDHYPRAFSALLAGGGLKTGQVLGATDAEGRKVSERPVAVPDLLATVATRLGIDPAAQRYAGERPLPIVEGGTPLRELIG